MKTTRITLVIALAATLLAGCSRTVEDVAKWESGNKVGKLIKALEDPKADVRLAATQSLGELRAESAVDALAAMYNDTHSDIILVAVKSLSSIHSDSTITPLSAALRLSDPNARLTAATALGEMKAVGAVPQLGAALDDAEIRYAALAALVNISDESGSAFIAKHLNDPSPDFRLTCVNALAFTGGDAAAEALTRLLADHDSDMANGAREGLLALGNTSIPYLVDALRDENDATRASALRLLDQLNAQPHRGSDYYTYRLAQASINHRAEPDMALVEELAALDTRGVKFLLTNCASPIPAFREHAFLALERIGESAARPALEAADQRITPEARSWAKGRSRWIGAPDGRLDLWAATIALDPTFSEDSFVARVPSYISAFDEGDMIGHKELHLARYWGTTPMLVALESDNEPVAAEVALILGRLGEPRAAEPLKRIVAEKLAAGEHLTTSPFYTALSQLNDPSAESLERKIRPNPGRAMNVFERKYGLRPISAETKDTLEASDHPLTYRVGYVHQGVPAETPIRFVLDAAGEWSPEPPLPDALP